MIDLHTHTIASDGILTSEQLVKKAKGIGLSAIAITNHDQVKGIPEAIEAGKKYKLGIVPGVELSCYWLEKNRKEFHILGYFIDFTNLKLLERLSFFQSEREKRARKSLEILKEFGFESDWNYLLKIASGSIGRPHITRAVLKNPVNKQKLEKEFGSIPSIHDFIEKYMIPGKPAYVEKAGFDPKKAIDLIHETNGVAVLAHPCFEVAEGDKETIVTLKAWGIDGLEAIAPFLTPEKTKYSTEYFLKVAKDNNLLVTGGSDYHGVDGIGAGLGLLEWGMKINDDLLIALKDYHQKLPKRFTNLQKI